MPLLVLALIGLSSHAQTPDPSKKTMHIQYGSSSWNNDSTKMDSAYMVVKDKNTGKLVQIQLEETEPDSSQFEGKFHVNLGEKTLDPQVYVPPKELRNPERDYKKMHELIQSGKIAEKPLITKLNEQGHPVFDVYDTKEQADAAQKVWNEQQRLQTIAKHQKLVKPLPDKDKVAAVSDAERKAEIAKLALNAANQEAERIRLDQIERQKALEREKESKALSEKERAARKAKAKILADEAMAHFTAGEFVKAEEKFSKAVDLDPENKTFAFKQGVTLYRLEKYNEAIVILRLAQVPKETEVERQYFMGLTLYRLKEFEASKAAFKVAASSPDKTIGPSSNFYLGIVQYSQEKYEDAKKSFEIVLDTSADPKMDAQAEEYIELIAQQMQFKKMQKQKWTLTGTLGTNYDSNVTYSPDQSSSATATTIDDIRMNTVADVAYRAIYTREQDLAIKGNANLTNSNKDESAPSDPWLYTFAAPYNRKGMAFGKAYVMGLKPSYEMLYMDPANTGTKSKTLTSTVFDVDNTFVISPTLISVYSAQVRQDKFDIAGSTGDDNFDSMKYTLKTIQIMYADKSRKEALMANFGLVLNHAEGKNKTYQRFDFGATYSRPMKWGYAWNAGVNAYKIKYSKASAYRSDLNLAISTGVDKPIRDWVTWSTSFTYTKNDSNIEATYEYDKYVILTQAVFTTNL